MDSLDDNSKKEVADDLKSYLDKTKSSREIECDRTNKYIAELRNVQKEMYPEHNGASVVVGANFANSGVASLSGTIKISSLGPK